MIRFTIFLKSIVLFKVVTNIEMANLRVTFSSQKENRLDFAATFNCLVIKEDVIISIFLVKSLFKAHFLNLRTVYRLFKI